MSDSSVVCDGSAKAGRAAARQAEICRGCANVAAQLGVTLKKPHVSCRKITVTNLLTAAGMMSTTVTALVD